jgi:hypothetical protein
MSLQDERRRKLLGRLSRQLAYTAPALALVAGGAAFQAVAENSPTEAGTTTAQQETLWLASAHAEGEAAAEGEGEAAAEGEGEAEAEGEGEAEAEGEGEAEAEGEGEAEAEGEGEAEAEGEGEAEAEGEGEAEAEGEGEAEAEGEGEAEAEGGSSAEVARPDDYEPAYAEEPGENPDDLIARGAVLFKDASLSTNGLSCASCHGAEGLGGYQETFNNPYPHEVAMGSSMFGMETVHADEMVQICMVAPMEADPLPWDSEELAALSAYVVDAQQRYAESSD